MAKIIGGLDELPERTTPLNLPGIKPPVKGIPYGELGSPEEADEFRRFIRELRNGTTSD